MLNYEKNSSLDWYKQKSNTKARGNQVLVSYGVDKKGDMLKPAFSQKARCLWPTSTNSDSKYLSRKINPVVTW